MSKLCCWKEDSNGSWHTECGNIFELMNGSPHDNRMRFCYYCGKSLCEHMYEEVETMTETLTRELDALETLDRIQSDVSDGKAFDYSDYVILHDRISDLTHWYEWLSVENEKLRDAIKEEVCYCMEAKTLGCKQLTSALCEWCPLGGETND